MESALNFFRENPNDYDLIVICDNFSLKRKEKKY